jgi:hypothetical protein
MRPIDADTLENEVHTFCREFLGSCRDFRTKCALYDAMKGVLVRIYDAPTLSPDEARGVGCEVCNYDKPLPQEGLSHDFYIYDGAIYHYDSELGWEGTDIAFCPFCGKRLRMKGAEDGTTD